MERKWRYAARAAEYVVLDCDVAERAFYASQSDRLYESLPLLIDLRPGSKKQNVLQFQRLGGDLSLIRRAETMLLVFVVALCSSFLLAVSFPRRSGGNNSNDGIHLAIVPNCGSLNGKFSDVNSGLLDPDSYKAIVSFGDSYSNIQYCPT